MKIKTDKPNKPFQKKKETDAKKYQDQVEKPIPEVIEVTRKVKAKEVREKQAMEMEKQLELQKIKQRVKDNVKEW